MMDPSSAVVVRDVIVTDINDSLSQRLVIHHWSALDTALELAEAFFDEFRKEEYGGKN
jgi:hypothetical protein